MCRAHRRVDMSRHSLLQLPSMEIEKGVDPSRKCGVESRKRFSANPVVIPSAPVAALMPNVVHRIPLDYTSEAERGSLTTGQPRITTKKIRLAPPWRGRSSAAVQRQRNTGGRQPLRVVSHQARETCSAAAPARTSLPLLERRRICAKLR